ncbi:Asp23/Gls24 family envelope stress response protein [Actinoplanes solisilvae]|uniref:Asp23/Gls24 family envelope stress response protein n=1 Tax=Actinoplanes solisilvae TaxID=2486853 RepID=UPI000FDC0868|nr:Asp23/Gls24 family envelope stress response protein [Actinoplanes solisilvae]
MSDGVAGVNSVSREVVEKIAATAARETPGVADLGGDVARFFDKVFDKIGLDEVGDATRGVHAEVKGASVEITVVLVLAAGSVVGEVVKVVQTKIAEALTGYGLVVASVNVKVDDIELAPEQAPPTL